MQPGPISPPRPLGVNFLFTASLIHALNLSLKAPLFASRCFWAFKMPSFGTADQNASFPQDEQRAGHEPGSSTSPGYVLMMSWSLTEQLPLTEWATPSVTGPCWICWMTSPVKMTWGGANSWISSAFRPSKVSWMTSVASSCTVANSRSPWFSSTIGSAWLSWMVALSCTVANSWFSSTIETSWFSWRTSLVGFSWNGGKCLISLATEFSIRTAFDGDRPLIDSPADC
mmetsp:Transcript_81679/g.249495  ORF Transcript_81679/g.249495 Transcript_81679/m.249495 type:complete len:228 (-) Transcript_81679:304-987(-)